jgi:hypothetical protein
MEETGVSALPELVGNVLDIAGDTSDTELWFRGHGKSSWQLRPGLYRRISEVTLALDTERRVLLEFNNRSRTLIERAGARDDWELFFLMQHYRLPTRLLDWSRNLLIGVYFAVYDDEAWKDQDDPPAVFVFKPKSWNTKVVGPDGITVAGPSGIITDASEGPMAAYPPTNARGVARKHALAIAGPEFASRIVAQRGVFTVFGTVGAEAARSLEEQEPELGPEATTLSKIRLEGDPRSWRRSLDLLGTGHFTAFPDLDGLARELDYQYFPGASPT